VTVISTLLRKSWADVTRHRARSFLTVSTVAVAVAGLGIFAMPSLLGNAMNARVARDRIYDAWVPTVDVGLTPAQLVSLRALPGIRALEARAVFETRMWVGAGRSDVLVVGVPDFDHQPVDAITRLSGHEPGAGQALVDPASRRNGTWDGGIGSTARVISSTGAEQHLTIVGTGESLQFTAAGNDNSETVLYVSQTTAQQFGGLHGINTLEVHLRDTSTTAARATMQRLHDHLDAIVHANAFSDLPTIRAPGTWSGQQNVNNYQTFLVIVAFVALISAIFLIANTMSTLVSEQRREVGILKAIGGRRRRIGGIYLRTAFLFGLLGGIGGAALAVLLANVLARHLGQQFFGITPSWHVPPILVAGGIALGIGVAVLASLPSLQRASRITVGDALREQTATGFSATRLDRALRRLRLAPMTSVGLRSVTRRRGRSAATVIQVAIAVAIMLSFLALGRTVVDVTNHTWDLYSADIGVNVPASGKPLSTTTRAAVAALPNVANVEPVYFAGAELDREQFTLWALPGSDNFSRSQVHRGRWLSEADDQTHAHVIVVGDALARLHHLRLGTSVVLSTATGPQRFEIVGIDDALINDGRIAYLPLETMRATLHDPAATNGYWVHARDRSNAAVDRLSTTIEDRLDAQGYATSMQVFHVKRAENVAANKSIVTTLTVLGLLIVAISLIGLINAITMNVVERTREIGVLRCIGARGRDIRRAFRAEGLTLALAGWAAGVPLGYLGARLLAHLVAAVFKFRFVFEFPLEFVWLALAGAIALAVVVMMPPLRRTARLRPGDALRYQ
jgi:putative ABC transport system permease protein